MSREFGHTAEVVEDLAEPIRAWRVWTVRSTREGWTLGSYAMTDRGKIESPMVPHNHCVWDPRGMEARCFCAEVRGDPSARHPECPGPPASREVVRGMGGYGCGIYGMRSEVELLRSDWTAGAQAWGEVELGGRVWRHELGYRAQYARVVRVRGLLVEFTHPPSGYVLDRLENPISDGGEQPMTEIGEPAEEPIQVPAPWRWAPPRRERTPEVPTPEKEPRREKVPT